MNTTCIRCKHWRKWTTQVLSKSDVTYGDCRRHAPILHPGPTPSLAKTKWPSTACSDTCGEFAEAAV